MPALLAKPTHTWPLHYEERFGSNGWHLSIFLEPWHPFAQIIPDQGMQPAFVMKNKRRKKRKWIRTEKAGNREQERCFKTWIGIKTFSSEQQIFKNFKQQLRYWKWSEHQTVAGNYGAGDKGVRGSREMTCIVYFTQPQDHEMSERACWHPYRLEMISNGNELYLVCLLILIIVWHICCAPCPKIGLKLCIKMRLIKLNKRLGPFQSKHNDANRKNEPEQSTSLLNKWTH